MEKEELDKMWEWIDRDVPSDFFETAGHLSLDERKRRWKEIPPILKPLAHTIIMLSIQEKQSGLIYDDHACLRFRCMLFSVAKDLEKRGINLHLPYAWFMDGPMIEPEWIVRITNGIIGWVCDGSMEMCGGETLECRFYGQTQKLYIISINNFANQCGFFNGKADVNNGYGCDHPLQEEVEDDQGKCLARSCPITHGASRSQLLRAGFKDPENGDDTLSVDWFVVSEAQAKMFQIPMEYLKLVGEDE